MYTLRKVRGIGSTATASRVLNESSLIGFCNETLNPNTGLDLDFVSVLLKVGLKRVFRVFRGSGCSVYGGGGRGLESRVSEFSGFRYHCRGLGRELVRSTAFSASHFQGAPICWDSRALVTGYELQGVVVSGP